jgi:type II protein arginine methyltransferase
MNDTGPVHEGFALVLDDVPTTFRPFAAALVGRPGAAEALVRLLGTLGEKAPPKEAEAFALQLREALPDGAYMRRITDAYLRRSYPAWYIHGVNDHHRNTAYARSLAALVRPESIVIEVGTGSGLFAMLAARAGARHVFSCEVLPEVAAIARENVARNGLQDRITVLNVRAEELHDMEGVPKGDILVHEFVSGEFLNSGMHGLVAGFRDKLLKPGAFVLPQFLGARGMLVGDTWLTEQVRVPERVQGFDVSAINRLSLHAASVAGPVAIEFPMSESIDLLEIDLCSRQSLEPASRVKEVAAIADGMVQGLLQWVCQRFPDGTTYENHPSLRCNWKPLFWPFRKPIAVRKGVVLPIRVRHTATELFLEEA